MYLKKSTEKCGCLDKKCSLNVLTMNFQQQRAILSG